MMRRPFNIIQSWLPDGTLIWRDGLWTLVDPLPTFGQYRGFDGWWREPTVGERLDRGRYALEGVDRE